MIRVFAGVWQMRIGGSDFKDEPTIFLEQIPILDWLNLPSTTSAVSLWDSLHDAEVVAIHSDLLDRTIALSLEIEHLTAFHKLADGYKFLLRLEGVQSARVLRYAMWPGGCSIPNGMSFEEQRRIVGEYQAKWREESASWNEFESTITRLNEQVFDISDAAITASPTGPSALKLCGHLNYAIYHEVCLRFETLQITGSDGKQFDLEQFLRMGEAYWAAYAARSGQSDV